jgi:hypothetical protein
MSYVLTCVTQMFTALGSKLSQGIATMTYTRSHTRPSQKDLGCVVYPQAADPLPPSAMCSEDR